jgi:hypothetical protein
MRSSIPKLSPASVALAAAATLLLPAGLVRAQAEPVKEPPPEKVETVSIDEPLARIDELRVRGQTRSITVKPRFGADYSVTPVDPARGSDDRGGGRSRWRVLTF